METKKLGIITGIVLLGVIGLFLLIQQPNIDSSEIDQNLLDEISLPSHGESHKSFIGEGGRGWSFEITPDIREEVRVWGKEVNESIVEIRIGEHINSTTAGNYRWHMALCNNTGSGLRYMEEDAQGGFDNAVWLDVNYGRLTDFGLNETWCGQSDNFGYVLFSNGAKNQFPQTNRLLLGNITNYTLFAGTGSTIIDSSFNAVVALRGISENICKDSSENLHVAYEGPDDDLWYGNSSDDGVTWSIKELFAGTILGPTIVCGATNNLTVLFTNGLGGDLDYFQSDDDGETFGTIQTAMDIINDLARPSCVLDSNEVVHCTAQDDLNEEFYYANSSLWDTEILLSNQGADDTDHADIEVDTSNNVYIIGTGSVQDDVDIWSSIDGWTTRNVIDNGLGSVNPDGASGVFGMTIDLSGNMYYAGPHMADLQVCNGTTSNWDGGASAWDCQETATQESRATDIAVSFVEEVYILHEDDNNVVNSDLLRTNTSDLVTFESRTNIQSASARQPAISSSMFPTSNRLNTTLRYIFSNASGVFYDSFGVTPPPGADSCTYVSGDYVVELSDNCVITDLQDASGNTFRLQGDAGSFTIASGGEVRSESFSFVPDDFDGDSHFQIAIGGEFSTGRT